MLLLPVFFDLVDTVVTEAIEVGDFMPEGVFHLVVECIGVTASHLKHRVFEDGDFVGKHEIVPCPSLRHRDTFIETEQRLMVAQLHFFALMRGRFVLISYDDIIKPADVFLG